MTESTTAQAPDRGDHLNSMLLPELKQLAQQLGVAGSSAMRKQELIAAISERQQQGGAPRRATRKAASPDEPDGQGGESRNNESVSGSEIGRAHV